TSVGLNSLSANSTGIRNNALGRNAGSALTSSNDNMYIGNDGAVSENVIIRIGAPTTYTKAFVQGTFGSTVLVGGLPVEVDSVGQLGTIVSSKRFKKNIENMNNESNFLYALRPVTFSYIEDDKDIK